MLIDNIIFTASGPGLRKNANRPKIDIEFDNGQKLFERQIEIIHDIFPSSTINYILGFHADKVDKTLENLGCNVYYNKDYLHNNIPYGFNLALTGPSLIIYGDIFFTKELIEHIPKEPSGSFLIKEVNGSLSKKNIGVGPNGVMSYCFPEKWSQIVYFDKNGHEYMNQALSKPNNKRKFTHEFINQMSEEQHRFDIFTGSGYLKEMDSIKDYNSINRWLGENKSK